MGDEVPAPSLCFSALVRLAVEDSSPKFDVRAAERFARLALACVQKEYPNKISHVLNSDADVAPPRKLTPAFCGCYDWHSSVHGHWLLARLARTFPDAPFSKEARAALEAKPNECEYERGGRLPERGRPGHFRATLRTGLAASAGCRAARVGRSRGPGSAANLRPLEEAGGAAICRPGCRNFPIRSGSANTTRPLSPSV